MSQSQSQADSKSQGHSAFTVKKEEKRAPFTGNTNPEVDPEVFFQLKEEEKKVQISYQQQIIHLLSSSLLSLRLFMYFVFVCLFWYLDSGSNLARFVSYLSLYSLSLARALSLSLYIYIYIYICVQVQGH